MDAVTRTGAAPIEMILDRRCPESITGRVVDEQGKPVKDFTVDSARVKHDDVYLLAGEVPWPTDANRFRESIAHPVPADDQVDVWAQPSRPLIGYTAVYDYTALVPGTYTVVAIDTYGSGSGLRLFRKVIHVDDTRESVVRVHFQDEDSRVMPF
ncbi:hypothetical protein [Myxococcus xanthus]|uniref:hypothetical protein n=1 Tax=Myxococcus xanthus TaxID=34 RepID=UPI00112851B9|nr:hypothetical protein [Myxococcus xanthus]QDE83643.1 hypothetical protein BHS07_19895 [Myxococcus xanthus]QDE97770.1 hypothetical protein BHS05_19045 [Myxococcus xanthus]QDF05449.1 hypothetical protein BHS04_19910 [Myxococcus xanthus]